MPMDTHTEQAKRLLDENGYTCVLYNGEREVHSYERGVKPLLTFLESNTDLRGFAAADKIVGAGAAHLYVLLGVRSVWANVISTSAAAVLENAGISALYGEMAPYIVNRARNGPCPIETATKGIEDSHEALIAIKTKLAELNGN